MRRKILSLLGLGAFALFIITVSCDEPLIPKPRGYFRIEAPKHRYVKFDPPSCPFKFEVPEYATVSVDSSMDAEPCWLNVDFTNYRGTIYLSYKDIQNDLTKLTEDCRSMAMKHTAKASAIDEME